VQVPGVLVGGQVQEVTLQRYFSWVVAGLLAGSSTPTSEEHVAALGHLGIRLVLTLTEEEPLPGGARLGPAAAV
jgi:hypothetical protein